MSPAPEQSDEDPLAGPPAGEDAPIHPEEARTLDGLFRARVRRSPRAIAYRYFDAGRGAWCELSWAAIAADVARWQAALDGEGLEPGERVGIFARGGPEWIKCDQAALGLGLVVVPLFAGDPAGTVAHILDDAGVRVLLIDGDEQWRTIAGLDPLPEDLRRVVSVRPLEAAANPLVRTLQDWLPAQAVQASRATDPQRLATIVYTSGTDGPPRGVMLSHRSILYNAHDALAKIPVGPRDSFLSFLPLSHMLERTVGYYAPMMAGATVAFCRAAGDLEDDLAQQRPTIFISVPRVYERILARVEEQLTSRPIARMAFRLTVRLGWRRFEWLQGRGQRPWLDWLWPLLDRRVAAPVRARLGGRLRCAITGGAALSARLGHTLIALGVPLQQGYGLTETSPVVSVNTAQDNDPASVGTPLRGVEVRVGADNELLVRGPHLMLGYWNNHKATYSAVDQDGYLHTGDQVELRDGRIYVTGRLKEILVLANGEKVVPGALEQAITEDPLFDQALVAGDSRPFPVALAVPDPAQWNALAARLQLDPRDPASLADARVEAEVLARIAARLAPFPACARVRRAGLCPRPWSVDNGLLTPTLKPRRAAVTARYADLIERLYASHGPGSGLS